MTRPSPNVLHVVTSDQRRGAEVAAVDLVGRLAEHDIGGSVVALASPGVTNPLAVPVLGPSSRHPRTLARLRSHARRHDLVVAHGSDTLVAVAAATIGTGVPFVYRMIGDPDVWGDVRLPGLRIGLPLRRAARVVTLWRGAADAAVRRHRLDPERVTVVPNGRDPARFRPPTVAERDDARRTLGPEDAGGGPVIAWIGALSEEKRPLAALEVARRIPDATLLLVGDGPDREAVTRGAEATTTPILRLGVVGDVRSVLWAADVLLVTSRTEGMPGVVVEALLTGLPVVAPAVGAIPELLGSGHPGLLPAASFECTDGVDGEHRALEVATALRRVVHEQPPIPTGTLERVGTPSTTRAWVDLIHEPVPAGDRSPPTDRPTNRRPTPVIDRRIAPEEAQDG